MACLGSCLGLGTTKRYLEALGRTNPQAAFDMSVARSALVGVLLISFSCYRVEHRCIRELATRESR